MKPSGGCGTGAPPWILPRCRKREPRLRSFSFHCRHRTTTRNEQWRNGKFSNLVEQATDGLPEPYRLVFVTRVIEGMSVEETADLLGIKPETVKTRLHRARQLVRDQLDKKIGPVLMDAFPFAGRRCERMTDAVMKRLGLTG